MPQCPRGHEVLEGRSLCVKCATCQLCHQDMNISQYQWNLLQLADWLANGENLEDFLFVHPGCLTESEKTILATETVTIPLTLYNKLNAMRLLIEPIRIGGEVENLSVKTNETDADIKTQQLLVGRPVEDQFLILRRLESACATISLSIAKVRKSIEIDLSKRDKQKLAAADSKRAEPKTPKTTGGALVAAVRIEKTKQDKGIAVLMAAGLSREEALESLTRVKPAQVIQ